MDIKEDISNVQEDVDDVDQDVSLIFDQQIIQDQRLFELETDSDALNEEVEGTINSIAIPYTFYFQQATHILRKFTFCNEVLFLQN